MPLDFCGLFDFIWSASRRKRNGSITMNPPDRLLPQLFADTLQRRTKVRFAFGHIVAIRSKQMDLMLPKHFHTSAATQKE